jgi:integrase
LFVPAAKAGTREQPITRSLADILRKEQDMADDPEGWIFPSARPKLSASGHRTQMGRPFSRAAERAGLDQRVVTPHVMRHTAITRLVQSGTDLPTIQKISGHKTLTMVLRYTHVHGTHTDQAITALDRGISERTKNEIPGTITPKLHKLSDHRS